MKFIKYSALSLLLVLPACKKSEKADALDNMNDALSETRQDALDQLESGGMGVDTPADMSKLHSALDDAEKVTTGQEKLAIELARSTLKTMEAMMAPLTAASADLFAALDYSEVKSVDDIKALSENVRKYAKINTDVKAQLGEGYIDGVRDQADKIGLEGATRKEFFSGFEPSIRMQLPLLRDVRDQDAELCEIILKQHEVLSDSFGKWTWSSDGLMFDDQDVADVYNKLYTEMAEVAAAQEATQRKVLSLQ